MHKSEDAVLAAFAAGADSYSLKDVSLDNLVQAIRLTAEGNAWIDPAIARVVLQQARQLGEASEREGDTVAIKSMTPDEQDLLLEGDSARQMPLASDGAGRRVWLGLKL